MSRGRWILAGILSVVIFFLIRDGFLAACGLNIAGNPKANFFLAAFVVGLVVVGLIVKEKYKGWLSLIPIICLLTLIAIGISSCCTSRKEKKEARNEKIREQIMDRVADRIAERLEGRVSQKLGLPQKSGSENRSENQGRRVEIFPPGQKPGKTVQKTVQKKSIYDSWGYKVATSTPPPSKKQNY